MSDRPLQTSEMIAVSSSLLEVFSLVLGCQSIKRGFKREQRQEIFIVYK
jgi:hypothetical protein